MTTTALEHCDECYNSLTINNDGFLVCTSCGLVKRKENILFDTEFVHVGSPNKIGFYNYGIDSVIKFEEWNNDLGKRLMKVSNNYRNPDYDRFIRTVREINVACSYFSNLFTINYQIREQMYYVMRKLFKTDIIKYKDRRIVSSSICYVVLRKNSVPITMKDVISYVSMVIENRSKGFVKKSIFRTVYLIVSNLNLKIYNNNDILNYIVRFCSELNLNDATTIEVIKYYKRNAHKINFKGSNPLSVVASCIYIVSKQLGIEITQIDISNVIGICPITIRTKRREIENI